MTVHVKDHTDTGNHIQKLGIVKMPDGYTMFLNSDSSHYYWLHNETGIEGVIWCNKWDCYRSAKAHSEAI